jgi:hypothetical protein
MATTNEICGFKTYRHRSNPQEKVFHDKFIEEFVTNPLNLGIINHIIFPARNANARLTSDQLSERELKIVISVVQWLGSNVGQSFLEECGYTKNQ